MSRTYRRPKEINKHSLINYVNRDLSHYIKRHINTKILRTKKPKEQYEEEYRIAKEEAKYVRSVIRYNGTTFYREETIECYYFYVHAYTYRKVPVTCKEVEQEAVKEYKKLSRDGRHHYRKCKGFRKDAANTVRKANKQLTREILRDTYEDMQPYPDTYLGKAKIWDWY